MTGREASSVLVAWLGGEAVGQLREGPGRQLTFQYATEHLALAPPTPLSLSLPLQEAPFPDALARPFFANLLPDAGLREAVARKLGLSPGNDFGLLEALGGECAGAVSLLPEGSLPAQGGEYRALSDQDFDLLVAELPRRPLLAGEQGIRLSLAGAQGKLPLRLEGDRIFIATGGLETTHIAKPELAGFQGIVRNEAFCMALAARAGLPVPRTWVRPGPTPVYLVERFDRQGGAGQGRVIRCHAEDLCQALGVLPTQKYEAEGGPGLAAIFGLLGRHSLSPAQDRLALLRWTIFNALIQNADAHAKNVSLLHTPDGVRLAPFYDLLCTGAWPDLAERLAMKVGGEARPDWLRRRHWERLAAEVGIAPRLVLAQLAELAELLPAAAATLAVEQASTLGPAPVVDRVLGLIEARCAQAGRALENTAD